MISITSIINTDLDPPFALTSDHYTSFPIKFAFQDFLFSTFSLIVDVFIFITVEFNDTFFVLYTIKIDFILYLMMTGWTGTPGAKAPTLNWMRTLRFVFVPSGQMKTWKQSRKQLRILKAMALKTFSPWIVSLEII